MITSTSKRLNMDSNENERYHILHLVNYENRNVIIVDLAAVIQIQYIH